ncbi:hypothetical protein BGZ50_008215 [Haplosporangium sp. Z 11]|nr:hypothetical protein BGZ50_008215 [Haplosporangium sp. Z 11]
MKVFSLFVGLAAIACVAAQVVDLMAVVDNANKHALAAGQSEHVIQTETASCLNEESKLRNQFLSCSIKNSDMKADTVISEDGMMTINSVTSLRGLLRQKCVQQFNTAHSQESLHLS